MRLEAIKKLTIDWNIVLVTLMGALVRLIGISRQPPTCDEGVLSTAADFFVKQGLLAYTHWQHPPLKYYLFSAAQELFGATFPASRYPSILFGIASIPLLFLLVKKMTKKTEIAVLAAFFLAVDPLHVAFSRVATEETTQAFWIILISYFFLLLLEKPVPLYLWLTGAALGLAISTKWSALPLLPALFIYFLIYMRKKRKRLSLLDVSTFFVYFCVLPLCVYALVYFPWLNKGHSISEWIDLQLLMARSIASVKGYFSTASTIRPLTWFLLPAYYILNYFPTGANRVVLFTAFTNPLTWLLVWPAFGLLVRKVRKNLTFAFPLILFTCLYLPLAITTRPIYPYSATSFAPFVAYFAAHFLVSVSEHKQISQFALVFIVLALAASFVLLPFAIGVPLPSSLSKPVTDFYALFVINR